MSDAARALFGSLAQYDDCLELIKEGEAEGLYLECKAPSAPRITRAQKAQLAEALSGFANTAGGVILWGASTTRHSHSGLDVITELEPIGAVRTFAKTVDAAIPTLTLPPVLGAETKVLLEAPKRSRGVAVTLVLQTAGDPVQSTQDNRFHFRSGDQFTTLPYTLIKRMFAASESPDLHPRLESSMVVEQPDGAWHIPLSITNLSSAIAEHTVLSLEVLNPEACEHMTSTRPLEDMSRLNPGRTLFIAHSQSVIHRGINQMAGELRVKLIGRRRLLRLSLKLYANQMQARRYDLRLQLAKTGLVVAVDHHELIS